MIQAIQPYIDKSGLITLGEALIDLENKKNTAIIVELEQHTILQFTLAY